MWSKHKRGLLSELIAEEHLVRNDLCVARPISGHCEFDLLAFDCGEWQKYQVKTIYWDKSKKRYICSLVTSHIRGNGRRTNKKYTKKSFDVLLAVEPGTKTVYEIPFNAIEGRRSITFYFNNPKTRQKNNNNFEEYKR